MRADKSNDYYNKIMIIICHLMEADLIIDYMNIEDSLNLGLISVMWSIGYDYKSNIVTLGYLVSEDWLDSYGHTINVVNYGIWINLEDMLESVRLKKSFRYHLVTYLSISQY
jgi:hypothetical protein